MIYKLKYKYTINDIIMNFATQVFHISDIKKIILKYAQPARIVIYEYEYYSKFADILKKVSKNDIICLCTNNQLGCKEFIVKIDENNNKYTELIWSAEDEYDEIMSVNENDYDEQRF